MSRRHRSINSDPSTWETPRSGGMRPWVPQDANVKPYTVEELRKKIDELQERLKLISE